MSKKDVLRGRSIVTKNIFDTANQTIEEIKRNNPLAEYFRSRGVEFTKSGNQYMALCPFHDDSNPSLSLNEEKQLFNCFGCGKSGSVIDAVVYYENVTTGEAIKILSGTSSPSPSFRAAYKVKEKPVSLNAARNEAPSHEQPGDENKQKSDTTDDTNTKSKSIETANTAENTNELSEKPETNITLTKVAEYYHRKLYENPEVITYLKNRGITKPEIYKRFMIGYAAGTLKEIIGTDQKEECIKLGILRENGTEHFRGCVIFPIIDDTGIVVGIYGRKIFPPSSGISGRGAGGEGIPHLYLKGTHKGIFNRKASKVFDEIILTESIIDALSLIELDIQNVQPIYGVNGFTDEHLQILKDDRVKTITIAFDNDEAGKTTSVNLKEKLLSEGFTVKVIEVPEIPNLFPEHPDSRPKDWNEYLVTGSSSTSLNDLSEKVKEALIKAEITALPEDTGSLKVADEQGGYIFTISGVSYRVSGVKEFFVNNLRVNIKAGISSLPLEGGRAGDGGLKYFDNLDLYSARSRANYSVNLSKAFSIEPKRIEKDLIAILEYLEAQRDHKLRGGEEVKEELTAEEVELGLSLLKDPKLFERIVEDMEILGYVGEDLNKKLLYLAASSRILDDPISVLILSQSASGKSMLVETVRKLIPPDEVIAVTSLSDQALNYVQSLMHKFLILGEAVHNEIIEHQIREMLSGKELSRLVTIKDEKTGKMSSREIKTPVIVSAVMSGTNHNINPENASRSFVVNADESKEQTQRIHEAQRGKHSLERHYTKSRLVPEIIRKHHAAQRLLKKIIVVNPFAKYLNFPDNLMRSRRDHDRLHDLIACVCFLRQYHKETKRDASGIEYIECDIADYEIAYDIMVKGVLSSTMTEIPRGTIDLYELICELAGKTAKKKNLEPSEVSLTQRDIREHTKLGQSWIKQHLRILLDYEYLLVIKGGGERSKGFYRIRALEPIQKLDLSMIPTPEQMKNLVSGGER